jgi:predicted PurR-regulated permease PerM
MERQVMDINIRASTIVKVIGIGLFFVLLYLLRDVLLVLIFSIIIASAVGPFADWLEKAKIPRLLAVLFLYLSFFGLIIVILSLVVPFISMEISQLTVALPKFIASLSGALEKAQQSTTTHYFDFFSEIQNLLDSFSQFLQVTSTSVINLLINIFGGILSFIATIIISFYLSVMRGGIINFLNSIVPEKYEEYVVNLWRRTERKVGRWFQGQLLLALTVGVLVFVGLSLLQIKYALLLGLVAMVLEIIPIAGPVISAIPGVILAFVQSPAMGIWVLLLYIAVQQMESHILTPLILGKSLGMNPIVVIIAVLVGGQMAGILGIIISVPIAVVIVEILEDLAKRKEGRRSVTSIT